MMRVYYLRWGVLSSCSKQDLPRFTGQIVLKCVQCQCLQLQKLFASWFGGTLDFDQRQNLKCVIIDWTVEQFSHREILHLRGWRLTYATLFFLCNTVNKWVTQRHFSPCPDILKHPFCCRQCPYSSNSMASSEITVTSLKTVISRYVNVLIRGHWSRVFLFLNSRMDEYLKSRMSLVESMSTSTSRFQWELVALTSI